MKTDAHSSDEARWAELMEAEACGALSEAERAELDQLSKQHEAWQHERQLLEAMPLLEPLDSDLSSRDELLIEGVLQQHLHQRRRRRKTVYLAAAVVLVPLAAAAAYLPFRATAPEPTPHAKPSGTPSVDIPGQHREEQVRPSERSDSAQSPPKTPDAQPRENETEEGAPIPPSAPPPPSAAELLARAQKARSAREYSQAVQAYQQLLRMYPRSGQARLAQVSLAQLQLAQGNANAALAGFNSYEKAGGALSQEAHYGKIQALRALSRTHEERLEIERFLARYPKSLQGPALKRRLGAISGGR